MRCPNCGFDSPSEMRFCGMYGAHFARRCPACGFANPPPYRFCGQCGTTFTQEPLLEQSLQPQLTVETEVPALPPPPPAQLEGERRLAAVILADVMGSTDAVEQIGTEVRVDKALVASACWHIGLISLGQREWGKAVDVFQSALQL